MLFNSCGGGSFSNTTGWEYNSEENGYFAESDQVEQMIGPGLVLVEGGTFVMGQTEQDVMYDWNNMPRRATQADYFIDETEVRNLDYLEYLYWIGRVFIDYPEVYVKALPDTLVWRERLAYNEPYVEYYLRHPAFNNYPVVGVSWVQAKAYSDWRTDRVNEQILVDEKILEHSPDQQLNEGHFTTEGYYAGLYDVGVIGGLPNYSGGGTGTDDRRVTMMDGIMLPDYRLPTEAEWEYAALAIIGETEEELIFNVRIYPWTGHYVRNVDQEYRGHFMANFQRGRGDLMGVAGALNDNAAITAPVDAFWPNDYGIYNMAGNVSEWVEDVYRSMSSLEVNDFRPFRGNVFQVMRRDPSTREPILDEYGKVIYDDVPLQDAMYRYNYQRADNINYMDGDAISAINALDWSYDTRQQQDMDTTGVNVGSNRMYAQGDPAHPLRKGITSLVNDEARVYKGGSWRDRVYWLSPGSRRFLDQDMARADIGFRCAMIKVGGNQGMPN